MYLVICDFLGVFKLNIAIMLLINSYYLGSNNQNLKITFYDVTFEIYFFRSFIF